MGRKLATGTCVAVLALGLGGCDKDFCKASVEDPLGALWVGLLCSGVNTRENTAPTASFTVEPTAIFPGETVTLDASASHDLGGIVKYEWDLDGLEGLFEVNSGEDAIIQQPLFLVGLATERREIGLQVTDEEGLTDTTTRHVTITGSGPAARFTVTPNPVEVGEVTRLDASSSTGAEQYSWDLDGNGSFEVGPTLEPAINKTFAVVGPVNVGLRVHGVAGLTATAFVRVIVISGSARAAASRHDLARAAKRRGFSARLTRVRMPDDLGRVRRRGAVTTVRGVVVRGRLVAARRGLGELRPFRRARWRARLTLVSRPSGARLTGVALARFPRGGGEACLRIRMHTRRRGAPVGTVKVLGGSGPAAHLRGSGRFRFSDLRPRGRLRARLGAPRPLPPACTRR